VLREVKYLRVHLSSTQMDKLSDVLVDQIRAIDNQRFIKRLGKLTKTQQLKLKQNLAIVLDL
jgi:mRNA interferase MazF